MANDLLPQTKGEWKQYAGRHKVKNQSLRMSTKLYSASQISYKHFLLLRTILPPIVPRNQVSYQTLGIENLIQQANQYLSDPAFRDYISDVTTRQSQPVWDAPWGGHDRLFRVPAIQQQQVIHDAAHYGSVRSEASVNAAFVTFLQAIADLVPQSGRQWTADRIKLTADFSTQRRKRQFVAYTDGQLEDTFSRRILALIECKRMRRAKHSPAVDMQEVAQMVAWVREHPGGPGNDKRVLVSKNGTDVYISVFDYDQEWLRYLNGGPGSIVHAGFACMRRYGPWRIQVASHMEHFARIIIALLLL
ncbi:hypothetical protein BDV38DRAFT_285724 [Aspergillus pseudotamarii]|uniref:Uncharacterized protein n=1 Tax=Aspergillus pseudotamarii TaxID=132259 RepID=A0A5N6SL34_ASPPS|nr:uncharacterized protein BDV38DRAFT_285724 [Aspergillus pseudotamarii]KAE8134607.1 hypothetical protein BDV38DRAFT_285724 [Aspergillus pseudotamarii]